MMGTWKLKGLTLVIGLLIAAVAAFWLWRDYVQEGAIHEQVLIVRGEAVLSALEGGIRSHRRLGNWFTANIGVVLEETAAAPGIDGLAVFDHQGALFASGGEFPETLQPAEEAVWARGEMLICKKTKFDAGDGMAEMSRRRGRGFGEAQTFRPGASPELDALLENPIWLAVLLDGSEFRAAMGKARRRFAFSLTATVLAVGLGVAALSLIQRHGRLAAELSLAREREKRLEDMALLGAGLAHETKNPLGLIRGLAQSLLRRCASGQLEEARRDAGQIVDEADRVVGRINAFLTYARPKPPDLEDVDLCRIVEETSSLFLDEADAKKINLVAQCDAVTVRADPGQLRQALVNLLTNAMAACGEGDSIEITVRTEGTRGFVICVRDTGEGIAPEDLPNLTKPYFTRCEGGTGLGLAIVQQIADAHGWRLAIQSQPGKGSLFCLRG